jgi:hypothetical protein
MRLATTLIGFGFTIVQFFGRLGSMSNVKPALAPYLPRYLGLALIFSECSDFSSPFGNTSGLLIISTPQNSRDS